MRWLVHGSLTEAASEALKRHRQEVRRPADIGLAPDATPAQVLEAARKAQLEIISDDELLARALLDSQARFGRSMVLLNVESGDIEQDDAIDRLFARYKRLSPARLYTVTGSRVKVRQVRGGDC